MNDPAPRTIHAVSELAEILRALVEDSLPRLWVEGEISNFSRPASGHWYFTLKDDQAQIRCAMFRNANFLVRPQAKNGDRVLVRASVSFYTARGDLQLICEHMEPAGEGALLRAFEDLKRRLTAEGLFDAARKRPVPTMPHRIGLITSATGAAVQDVLAALNRRFPLIQVNLWPVPVQGTAAAPAIVEALRKLPQRVAVDAILLVRGGGSLEDLWAFNEEIVARAIASCTVPVVTGIGHEVDYTIADFVADLRAPTPTAAAELLSPDRAALSLKIDQLVWSAEQTLGRVLQSGQDRLARVGERLQRVHPQRALQLRAQRLDENDQRLRDIWTRTLREQRSRHASLMLRLAARDPADRLVRERIHATRLSGQLRGAMRATMQSRRDRLLHMTALLNSISPQAVLDRGYAIARTLEGEVIRDAATVTSDQNVELILSRGRLRVKRSDQAQ